MIKLVRSDETLTWRRHTKIDKCVFEQRSAQTTACLFLGHACTPQYARRLDGHMIHLVLPGPWLGMLV
ncbi:hypothetical protein ABE530_16575 [Brucella sp. TWI559]